MARAKKHSSKTWFIAVRGSYLPNSWQAWVLYIPYTAYIVGVLMYVVYLHLSIPTAAFTLIPNWIAALAVMTWIAQRHC